MSQLTDRLVKILEREYDCTVYDPADPNYERKVRAWIDEIGRAATRPTRLQPKTDSRSTRQ